MKTYTNEEKQQIILDCMMTDEGFKRLSQAMGIAFRNSLEAAETEEGRLEAATEFGEMSARATITRSVVQQELLGEGTTGS